MLRNRLIAIALLILSIVAISFYGGPVTYGFFFLCVLVPAVSAGYCFLVYLRYRIYQVIVTKNVVVGSPTDYYFTLQNEDFYSFAGVKVEFFSDFSYISELNENNEYELPPQLGLKKETVLVCKYRGEYDVGIRNIIVQDYLRLFSFNFKNKENLRAIVMPRLEILETLRHPYSPDVYKDSRINPTEQDVLVREYIPGDDIRNINWKISAHMGKPYVRTKTGLENPSIAIIMDSCRFGKDMEDFLPLENKVLETTIAVVYYYLSKGINASVFTYEGAPKKYSLQGMASFEDFYAAMGAFAFKEENTSDKLFKSVWSANITSCSMAYMIIHELDEKALVQIEELNKNGLPVTVYHISDDEKKLKDADFGKNTEYTHIGYEDKLKEVL
ncbi:MAG: DUF58 domain-containing protein [Lachnospiraceae bacterium]|nr:DUF58 domain-containing protein [Lachnospiraceae bacterium]